MAKHEYSRWRHGGWYVQDVRYPSGAIGCVSANFPDKKWRIVCDERKGDFTYPSRDAAADAEAALVADLHKLAAASDMLAALEAMNHAEHGYCICPCNDGRVSHQHHATICIMARAAIARARGT